MSQAISRYGNDRELTEEMDRREFVAEQHGQRVERFGEHSADPYEQFAAERRAVEQAAWDEYETARKAAWEVYAAKRDAAWAAEEKKIIEAGQPVEF